MAMADARETPKTLDEIERVLDALYEPVLLVDGERRIAFMNATACDLFGADLTGRQLVRAIRHPAVLDALETVLSGSEQVRERVHLNLPLASLFHVAIQRFGKGAVVSLRDVGHEARAQEMRTDFVANVSHELRSPLAALKGMIETLQGPARDDPEAQARFLEIMEREARRMDRLISDLLSLSRVEVDERVRPTAPVDVAAVLGRVLSLARVNRRDRTVAPEIDLPSAVVPGDEDQLEQVFANLVENAIKYSAPDTTVRLRLREVEKVPGIVGPALSVAVHNEGEPIAAEHIPRLTERFYRVDGGRSRDRGGTGLGLAIVKHIVNRHRGRLLIRSTAQEGTTFTVNLPRQ